jgi:hypothetical protein
VNVPIPDPGVLRDLTILTGHDDLIFVKLFQNNITPTVNSQIADFTECNFDGYVAINLTYNGAAVHDVANHVWYQPCETVTWTKAAGTTGNNVYGCFLVDNSGILRGCGRLDGAPAPMTAQGQMLSITLNRRMSSEFATS